MKVPAGVIAALKHALGIFAFAFVGVVVNAVVTGGGLTGVAWPDVLLQAVDAGAYAVVTGLTVLTATPVTRQYGVGRHVA